MSPLLKLYLREVKRGGNIPRIYANELQERGYIEVNKRGKDRLTAKGVEYFSGKKDEKSS